jgi:hypothetical protein
MNMISPIEANMQCRQAFTGNAGIKYCAHLGEQMLVSKNTPLRRHRQFNGGEK